MEVGDYYTVDEVARILKLTPGRIRQMLRSGELEGERDDNGRWRIPQSTVHDRPRPPRVERPPSAGAEDERSSEPLRSPESLSDLLDRVARLERELGRSEGARELEAVARSTLDEQLKRERDRADKERERAERLQEDLDRTRVPWWRKLFGAE
jgi:excisionase family DNA binding protein